jgi:hypothetical protein
VSGAKPLAEVNLLEIRPVRLAGWEEIDGRVVLLRPPPSTTGVRRMLDTVLVRLSAHRIRLDEAGSFAWLRLDGRRTVAEVAAEMRRELGAAIEPAEERLGVLVRQLHREELLAYPEFDETGPDGPRP